MKTFNVLAFALLITTAGCVTGPPVESQREKRVERSLEGANHYNNQSYRYVGYRDGSYEGHPYNQSYRANAYRGYPYQGYRVVNDGERYNDPMGNYDQNHDRMRVSGY